MDMIFGLNLGVGGIILGTSPGWIAWIGFYYLRMRIRDMLLLWGAMLLVVVGFVIFEGLSDIAVVLLIGMTLTVIPILIILIINRKYIKTEDKKRELFRL